MKVLTEKQQEILSYIRERAQTGVPPSVREIGKKVGLKSTSSVYQHLKTLENAGYISKTPGINRAITLPAEEAFVQIPVMGRVTAGMPILAIEEIEGYIPFNARLARGKELFALRIVGTSMIDAGILDSDTVIVQKTAVAANGEIIVALLDEEATVKRIYFEPDCIRLQPENCTMEPIFCEDVLILGKVVGLVREY